MPHLIILITLDVTQILIIFVFPESCIDCDSRHVFFPNVIIETMSMTLTSIFIMIGSFNMGEQQIK